MKPHLGSIVLWALCATTVSGCGGLLSSDQPADNIYWLEAAPLELGTASSPHRPDLVVAVRTLPGLDTDRILVRGPGARLNYYAGARWPDHLPEVVTALVRLSLESSGYFNSVTSHSAVRRDDWVLELELRQFFAVVSDSGAATTANVELAGQMHCGTASHSVKGNASVPAGRDTLSEIVAAFQRALDTATTDLGKQLEDSCT
ncbi:MAG: ABC-type transport auxiliary lipoprotein family protein [Gammaproteobacteria bacterium]|nr:ABC-type transport auxiliary lipoprotein family protein [Gammaproteobacteria bacterium]